MPEGRRSDGRLKLVPVVVAMRFALGIVLLLGTLDWLYALDQMKETYSSVQQVSRDAGLHAMAGCDVMVVTVVSVVSVRMAFAGKRRPELDLV